MHLENIMKISVRRRRQIKIPFKIITANWRHLFSSRQTHITKLHSCRGDHREVGGAAQGLWTMSLPTDLDFDEAMESSYQYSGLKPLMDQNEESRRSKYQLRSLVMSIAVLAAIAAATVLLYAGIQPTQQKGLLATDILAASSIGDSETSSKPNIIFILADDMGFNSITPAVAPTLYALQESGIRLSTYYAQETCTPGRAALLTGRYPLSVGLQYYECTVDTAGGLSLEETLFSEVLQDGGYTTYMFGKWNLGNSSPLYLPTARGFSYYLGYLDGFTNYWSKLIPDFTTYTDLLWSNSECYYMYDANDVSLYSTHLYGDKAVAAIKYHNYEKPLFMYLAFQAVHDPFSG